MTRRDFLAKLAAAGALAAAAPLAISWMEAARAEHLAAGFDLAAAQDYHDEIARLMPQLRAQAAQSMARHIDGQIMAGIW